MMTSVNGTPPTAAPQLFLERSSSARIVVHPLRLQGEACLDVRLWRRSPSSTDAVDWAPTAAGLVLPVDQLEAFVALLEAVARTAP